jgi:hypothetical protein
MGDRRQKTAHRRQAPHPHPKRRDRRSLAARFAPQGAGFDPWQAGTEGGQGLLKHLSGNRDAARDLQERAEYLMGKLILSA